MVGIHFKWFNYCAIATVENYWDNMKKNKKKEFVPAILLAIFLSLFVWLYLGKYKKFFIWLGITFGTIIIQSLLPVESIASFVAIVIGYILSFIMWISAIVDALKLRK